GMDVRVNRAAQQAPDLRFAGRGRFHVVSLCRTKAAKYEPRSNTGEARRGGPHSVPGTVDGSRPPRPHGRLRARTGERPAPAAQRACVIVVIVAAARRPQAAATWESGDWELASLEAAANCELRSPQNVIGPTCSKRLERSAQISPPMSVQRRQKAKSSLR